MNSERPVSLRRALALVCEQTRKYINYTGSLTYLAAKLIKQFDHKPQLLLLTFLINFIRNTEEFSHLLVYWPAEGSVTAVSASAVNSSTGTVGSNCEVTINSKKHAGRIAAKG